MKQFLLGEFLYTWKSVSNFLKICSIFFFKYLFILF